MAKQEKMHRPDDRTRAAASGTEVNATAPRTDEVGGCCGSPTDPPQAQAVQRPGGGGAPATGNGYSPAEAVNEKQKRQSGMSDD